MPKNRQLKASKRLRFDKTMLAIGLISICGGLLVYGSYAFSRVDTTLPGNIKLARLSKDSLGYEIDIKKGLEYCFSVPLNSQEADIVVKSTLTSQKLVGGCFTATSSADSARINLQVIDESGYLLIK